MALNHEGNHFQLEGGSVEEIAIPFRTKPGFAIPLVYRDKESNAAYVQRVDINRKIVGYEIFHSDTRKARLKVSCRTKIGGPEIFALIDPNGQAHAGTRRALQPLVKRWVREVEGPLLQLSFAQFCGEQELAKSAARDAVKAKERDFKDHGRAARWFVSSVIVAELVAILAKDAGGEALRALDEDRVGAVASVSSTADLDIEVRISADFGRRTRPYSGFYRDKLRDLLELTRAATGYSVDIIFGSEDEVEFVKDIQTVVDRLRRGINALQRQEQRIAYLLAALIEDREAAVELLSTLHDRAAHAETTFEMLRGMLALKSIQSKNMGSFIAERLPSILSSSFPMNRGYLLLEMAQMLGGEKDISDMLRYLTLRTKSVYVEKNRAQIIAALDRR